jgi:glycosidase
MYGVNEAEVQLPMDFQLADVNQLSALRFRELLDQIEFNPADGQPYFFFSNHDQARTWDRYCDGVHNDQIAKLMAALLLTTRTTPQMYYGRRLVCGPPPPLASKMYETPWAVPAGRRIKAVMASALPCSGIPQNMPGSAREQDLASAPSQRRAVQRCQGRP